ncbi:axonemal dynein light chain domain-containing protein 1-like [Saccoglossus kowalevskii]|uniref:Axonemal dynein light chain domain-containing protein 1-like n=1 Tax=Saccoglossus kowalevskii TaxID=10224 RepID=A0ABM0GWD5_SACKO|nr:PREDICTED: axonemal dynein light chain domain-containing protein 1-like [Saccoglossus kowalevskii]
MSTAVSQNPGNELALAPMPPPGSPHQNTSRSDSRHSTPRMTKVKVVLTDEDREESPLPELKSSEMTVDRTKPLPTSLQSEFIPEDILNTLTQLPQSNQDQLGPPLRTKVITYRVCHVLAVHS